MENQNFQAINDEELNTVAGGKMSVMAWIQYASTDVVQPLYALETRAFGSDREIVSQITSVVRGTLSPTAEISRPITNLWQNDFPAYYAPRIADQSIKTELQAILYRAYSYIRDHMM